MKRTAYLFFVPILIIFYSCNDVNQPVSMKEIDPDDIYFDYKVTGEEEYDKLTIWIQFRYGGPDGDAILLEDPAEVELDGELFPVDSTPINGPFYELHKPIATFIGKHSIVYTGLDKKQYKEKFEFKPLLLTTQIPDTLRRKDLALELSGLEDEDSVRVLLTDTSFYSDGVNKTTDVFRGRLILTRTDLGNLADGPVKLEIIMEKERLLKNNRINRGRLLITYGLKREFILRD